jgi:hypothetical protein
MINWSRTLGCALLMGLSSCAADPTTTTTDGGYGDAGTCLQQSECPCTCICPSGAHGITYASCVDGVCTACGYYCNAYCG